jgi:hypothetical protein
LPHERIVSDEPLLAFDQASTNKVIMESILASADAEAPSGRAQPAAYAAARRMLAADRLQVPPGKLCVLLALFAWLLLSQIVKDEVKCGGFLYWFLVLSVMPLVGGIMAFVRPYLIDKGSLKKEVRQHRWAHTALASEWSLMPVLFLHRAAAW